MDATDPRTTFAAAATWFADLLARVPDHAWTASGLGVWDVRALAGHTSRALVTVDTYLDRPSASIEITSPWDYYVEVLSTATDPAAVAERGRSAGEALGPDPAAHVRDLVARVVDRLPADDPIIETIAGGMRLSDYLPTRTFELVVHGYDLAGAAGLEPAALDERVLVETSQLATRLAVRHGSGREVLSALTGRSPLPPGFSVV